MYTFSTDATLIEHVALDWTSWSIKSVLKEEYIDPHKFASKLRGFPFTVGKDFRKCFECTQQINLFIFICFPIQSSVLRSTHSFTFKAQIYDNGYLKEPLVNKMFSILNWTRKQKKSAPVKMLHQALCVVLFVFLLKFIKIHGYGNCSLSEKRF